MRRTLVAAVAFAGTAACSFIFELPASEGPIPGIDAASTDGGADGPAVDARPPADVEPPPRFCATRTMPSVYCNDFDDIPTPTLESIGTPLVAGAQFALSSAVSLSPPRSLLASIVRGTNASAALTRALGTDPDGVTLSFDMLVSAWATSEGRLSQLEFGDAAASCVVRLDGSDTTWALTQTCTTGGVEAAPVTTASTSAIVRGKWQRFAIAVQFAPTTAVTLDIDGVRVVDTTGAPGLQRGQVAVGLGTRSVPAGTVTTFQDNVLVTTP